jgi:mannitol-1-phosphate 5-dehydrogenase
MSEIAIFGAGKIARGFLAHLISLSNKRFFFIERDSNLVQLLKSRKKYSIHVMGHSEKDYVVSNFEVYQSDAQDDYLQILSESNLILTSVGGQNLPAISGAISKAIMLRFFRNDKEAVNIITCENWIEPAGKLKKAVIANLPQEAHKFVEEYIGFSESVVLRSATDSEPERLAEDPLVVNVQDYWILHINGKTVKGTLPKIAGFENKMNFAGMLTRKLYTYNAANGSASYLGFLKGYERIDQAVADPEILEILMKVYDETSKALSKEFGISYEDEYAFSMTSLAKLRNKDIVDFIVRNARDPIRKLGVEDRLVGPSLIALKYGIQPEGLATAIAAAIYYSDPNDARAKELTHIRLTNGIDYILDEICKIKRYPAFKNLIIEKILYLRKIGWIKEY